MSDTTIGYAVLQIIPSLKGVSEAIEKQISGQVVEVKIEPKTDAAKVDKSINDAVKKKPVEVPVTPKVDQKKLDQELQATKDKILKGAKDWDEFNRRTAEKWAKSQAEAAEAQGKNLSKAIVEASKTVRDTKIEMPQIDTRSMGTKLRDAVTGGLRELNNNPALKDIQEQIGQQVGAAIGQKIGDALANTWVGKTAQSIAETVQTVTGSLAAIKQGDAAGGLNGIADALNNIGKNNAATKLHEFATEVQPLQDKFGSLKTNIEGSASGLLGLTNNSGKIAGGLNTIAGAAGPLAAAFVALDNLMPGFDQHLQNIMKTGGNFKDWVNTLVPGTNLIDRYANNWINPGSTPAAPNSPIGPNGQPKPGLVPRGGSGAPPTVGGIPIPGLVPVPGRAGGGQISGAGSGVSDSILARVSNGEYIVNANATRKNLPLLEVINSDKLPGFEGGGLVAGSQQLRQIIMQRFGIANIGGYRPGGDGFNEHSTGRALDVMVGNDRAKGDAVKDFALANASAIDLKWAIWRQHLYYPGGGGYDMGDRGNPTQNHMDHVHIFSGPGIANGLLGALQGSAGGPGDGGKGDAKNVGGTAAPTSAGGATPVSSAGTGGSSARSSGGFSIPSSFSDMAGFGLSGLGKGVGTTSSGSDLSLFGNAAASAVSGQVSSALGAFGIPGAPRWLGGISQLVGGISVGGSGGGGASPASSVIPTAAARMPGPAAGMPNGMASVNAGQQSGGPQTVFNIQTARVEDAFVRADRLTKEKALSKLGQF